MFYLICIEWQNVRNEENSYLDSLSMGQAEESILKLALNHSPEGYAAWNPGVTAGKGVPLWDGWESQTPGMDLWVSKDSQEGFPRRSLHENTVTGLRNLSHWSVWM